MTVEAMIGEMIRPDALPLQLWELNILGESWKNRIIATVQAAHRIGEIDGDRTGYEEGHAAAREHYETVASEYKDILCHVIEDGEHKTMTDEALKQIVKDGKQLLIDCDVYLDECESRDDDNRQSDLLKYNQTMGRVKK